MTKATKARKLHMIGNAHIDPVWLWQWQEGYQEIKATFRSALDRMNEYPDFLFTGSSAAFYEWVEENDPDMFAQIKARIEEGRWEIVGGWWIQPDCNIPSGESFARQALYAQRYFKEKFGVTATVGYNPDSFGHAGMLPQILKQSGMDRYVFMRPGPHEKGLPGRLFWWESDDGSRVLTFRIPFEYCTGPEELRSHIAKCMGELKEPFDELMCFYGVGNHGGGPTKANLAAIARCDADPEFPTLELSTPNRYFDAVEKRDLPIPVVHDDLQYHAVGCYAVHSGIKKWNRQGENLLLTAEKFSALAERISGQPYPLADLTRGWKNVLFNQFHDIMGGTSLEPAYDDARDMHGEAMSAGARALNHAIQSLSWRIKIDQVEGMRPVVVFNPHAWPVRACIELEGSKLEETYVLVDDQGRQIPWQGVRSLATVSSWRRRLCFVADLPPMGYRTYRLLTKAAPARQEFPAVQAEGAVLENARLRLEIDPATGTIKSLLDKVAQFEVIAGGGARAAVIEDKSDTWSHGVTVFDKEIGEFRVKSVKLVEHGPVKAVLRVESEYGNSTLMQDFSLYQEINQIDVAVTVDWREQHKLLKLRFPTALHFPKATFEASYGHIERPVNGDEVPAQNWIDLSGVVRANNSMYGLSLLNDGKYSFSVKEREMSLTVLRSPIYAHHDPYVPQPDQYYTYMDQGIQRFTYSLLPHAGGWEEGETVRRAAELNARPVAIVETYHEGPLPQSDSFLAVDRANIIVSAVKKAEEGDDLIVRAYETNGVATRATITVFGRKITADFAKCEIKTFRVPVDAGAPATECNLIEW
ncbi:MAG TPA: glycoside hydrolase family 38 C-terminal domain-containing protein [Symbiobacteriaceae bacterium]|nr:glycoside hydrolase family 38 C-terminal domain-containing protein [Symbiobacteriaceae bacterium]